MVDYINIHIYTDGASRKNPGSCAIGVIFLAPNGSLIAEHRECIGIGTCNEAEYKAIITALEMATKYCRNKINLFSDSELVLNQINGKYAIKKDHLRKLCILVKEKERLYEEVIYTHAPKTHPHIKHADRLSNQALDGKYGK